MINYQDFMNNGQSQSGAPMMDTVRDELGNTLRSVRDTLAISFQTLNLTLSSINNTMRSISTSMTPSFMTTRDRSVIPAGIHGSSFLGSMSDPMAQAVGSSSMFDLMTMRKPFNVSAYEWSQQSNRELGYRATGLGTDMTLGLASIGATAGAAFGLERGGMAAARKFAPGMVKGMSSLPGRLAMGLGAWNVASLAIEPVVSGIAEQADEYQQDYAGLRRMSNRFGNEFGLKQSRTAAKGIHNLAYNEVLQSGFNDTKLGLDGFRAVAMQGMQMNMFQGDSPEDLVKQVEKASKVVKFLTGIMGSKDVTETMEAVGQLKSMGVNVFKDSKFAMQLGNMAYAKGTTMGVQPSQLLKTAMESSAGVYGQLGLPSFGGIMPMMNNLSALHELEKTRYLTAGEISAGGGHQGIARSYAGSMANMMANPQVGGVVLAAGMDKFGNFNQGLFNKSMKGNGMDLVNSGASGLLGGGPAAMFKYQANKTKMYEEMMKEGKGEIAMERAMGSYMDMMPFADQGGYEDKIAFYASMYKQMTGSTNDAEAKLFALKKMNPKLNNSSAEKQAMRGVAWNKHQTEHGRFSDTRRAFEEMARTPEHISNFVKRNVTHPLVDAFSDFVGEPDKQPGYATMSASELGPHALANMNVLSAMAPSKVNGPDSRALTVDQIRGIEQEERQHGSGAERRKPFTLFSMLSPDSWRYNKTNKDTQEGAAIWHAGDKSYYDFMMDPSRNSYASKLAKGDYQKYQGAMSADGFEAEYQAFADKHGDQTKSGLHYLMGKRKDDISKASEDFISKNGSKSVDTSSLGGSNYSVDKKVMQGNVSRGMYRDKAKELGISESAAGRLEMHRLYGTSEDYKKDLEMQLAGTNMERGLIDDASQLEYAKRSNDAQRNASLSTVSIGDMNKAAEEFNNGGLDMKQFARALGSANTKDAQGDINTFVDMVFDGKGKGSHEFKNASFDFLYEKNANGELSKLRKSGETREEFIARLSKAQQGVTEEAYAKTISGLEGMDEKNSRELTRRLGSGDFKGAKGILDGDKRASGAHNQLMKDLVGLGTGDLKNMSKDKLNEFLEEKLGVDASSFQGANNIETLQNAISYANQNGSNTEAGQQDLHDKEKLSTYADGNALRVKMDTSGEDFPDNMSTREAWDKTRFMAGMGKDGNFHIGFTSNPGKYQ